jgi:hypothetical protein
VREAGGGARGGQGREWPFEVLQDCRKLQSPLSAGERQARALTTCILRSLTARPPTPLPGPLPAGERQARALPTPSCILPTALSHRAPPLICRNPFLQESAKREHEELRAYLTKHNDALMEEARAKFAEAIEAARLEFEELRERLREEHAAEMERVVKHNQEIWPQVWRGCV